MNTRTAASLVVVVLTSGCLQGSSPTALEGGSIGVAAEDWRAPMAAAGPRGALQVGERARGTTTADRPVLVYRFRARYEWVVDVTTIALGGGDPSVAVFGPLSPEGDGEMLGTSDVPDSQLERLSGVDLEYDREYLAVVGGVPGLLLETQVSSTPDPLQTFELPSFVLGEPRDGEPLPDAWRRACAAEEARLRDELGDNRVTSFDCGTPEAFDAGGVAALASTALLRFTTSWPCGPGHSTTSVFGVSSADRRAAFASFQERCGRFLMETRSSLGVHAAGAACGTPVERTQGETVSYEADVAYFVFGGR